MSTNLSILQAPKVKSISCPTYGQSVEPAGQDRHSAQQRRHHDDPSAQDKGGKKNRLF